MHKSQAGHGNANIGVIGLLPLSCFEPPQDASDVGQDQDADHCQRDQLVPGVLSLWDAFSRRTVVFRFVFATLVGLLAVVRAAAVAVPGMLVLFAVIRTVLVVTLLVVAPQRM